VGSIESEFLEDQHTGRILKVAQR